MGAVITGCILVAALIGKAVFDTIDARKKRLIRLANMWGCPCQQDIPHNRFLTISSFYESMQEDNLDVDDITWNDLDMDALFLQMNQTFSAAGEEYLYALLHKPVISEKERLERDQIIEYFIHHSKERSKIGEILLEVGKLQEISVFEYLCMLDKVPIDRSLTHIICFPLMLIAGISIAWWPVYGITAFMAALGYTIISYYHRKAQIGKYYSVLSYMLTFMGGAQKISQCSCPEIQEYIDECKSLVGNMSGFRRGSFLIFSGKNGSDGFLDIVMDYVRMFLHVDLVKFNSMIRIFMKEKNSFVKLFTLMGKIDAMIAVASYRTYLGLENICKPEFVEGGTSIEVKDLFHPLISDPVKSSFHEQQSVLITGSNASGKSTFLKSVAINAILSQSTNTSLASCYKASRFKVFSSMALRDNIFNNESYFIVEIKSLKRILDHVESEIPMLCFVDEVLRGTNTLERIAASSQILLNISQENALCFAATHDIELTDILEKHYSNYHFTEDIVNNHVIFSYELLEGKATSRNAIRLLSMLGYDKSIVKRAEEGVEEYLESGNWTIFE